MAEAGTAPLDDVRHEGLRLVRAAQDRALPVRLLGGVAVWARCPSAARPALARSYGDIDVATLGRSSGAVQRFLEEMGYQPDKLFNALHGAHRLNFTDPAHDRSLDVLVDRFTMCHALDLRTRIGIEPMTIPLSDLLLTKLQVVELNGKDVVDIVALLADHPVGAADGRTWAGQMVPGEAERDAIGLDRVTGVLSADWGFEHTVRRNLARLPDDVARLDLPSGLRDDVVDRVAALVAALDRSGKSMAWRVRARIGERMRWYELPEESRH